MPHPLDELPEQLWKASREAARRAVLNHTSADPFDRVQAAVNLGLAAEMLLMSCVASIDTNLLGENATSKMMLSKSVNVSGVLDSTKLRTINWGEAHKLMLARDADPLGGLHALMDSVMGTRNAAAHTALTTDEGLQSGVLGLVKLVTLLHPYVSFEEGNYWGEEAHQMVTEVTDKETDRIRQSKLAKTIRAVADYERIKERFSGDALARYIETARERPRASYIGDWGNEYEVVKDEECPACHNAGNLYYLGYDDGEIRGSYDAMTDEEVVEVEVYYTSYLFDCPVCALQLDGNEIQELDIIPDFAEVERYVVGDERFESLMDRIAIEPDFESF